MTKIAKQYIAPFGGIFHHLVWTVTPRPVWIVGTCNDDGTSNLSTITCVSNTPGPPEHLILSMAAKRTIANIERTGRFSVALAHGVLAGLADYVGSVSGEDGAKDALAYGVDISEGLGVPVLDAAWFVLECKLAHTLVFGDFHTFFGEVAGLHIADSLVPPTDSREAMVQWFQALDIPGIDPLVYHSVRKYFRVGEKR